MGKRFILENLWGKSSGLPSDFYEFIAQRSKL
jgi:hypothetical protein